MLLVVVGDALAYRGVLAHEDLVGAAGGPAGLEVAGGDRR